MVNYLGYRGSDADTAWGRFFDPRMAPLPGHVVQALQHGPQADPTLLEFDSAPSLLDPSYHQTENGYGTLRDGGFHVAVRTDMPGVTPNMWTWWFGWHGNDARRYKLWHPRAHVSAQWSDRGGAGHYIGRTSLVIEYIGSAHQRAAIRFVDPAELGLAVDVDQVAICARLASPDLPVDVGWLIHHVRPTETGSEMRSRFWMGGQYVAVRHGNRLADKVVRRIAARMLPDPRDLLVHCAQEMNHLAVFLPELHGALGDR
ncbi:MAG: hypothetical protein U0Q20_06030 [Mycobacterium sp.]